MILFAVILWTYSFLILYNDEYYRAYVSFRSENEKVYRGKLILKIDCAAFYGGYIVLGEYCAAASMA